MRPLKLLLVACALALNVGCESFKEWTNRRTKPPGNSGAMLPVSAEQLVGYLNGQAERLQSVSYGEAVVSARQGDGIRGAIPMPPLRGNLAAAQPRNFRMVVKAGLADARVDLGSNPDKFWVYFDAPTVPKTYVYASHSDFSSGRAQLPANLSFEPDWIMQAMGMTTFPLDAAYEQTSVPGAPSQRAVPMNEKDRTYTLRWQAKAPNGVPVVKEIVFAADDVDAGRDQPQVRKHLVRDAKGKLICSAEVKSAKTVATGGTDPITKRPYVLQYPTLVVLRWEEEKFEMSLKLDGAQVNHRMTQEEAQRLFTLPTIPGVSPVNLAEARFERK